MTIPVPVDAIVGHLVRLVRVPSPTGHAGEAIRYLKKRLTPYEGRLKLRHPAKGGLLVTLKGEDHSSHRYLTAHVDTLGAMVKEIKPNGRLRLTRIGGFNWHSVEGNYCTVETRTGRKVTGTILASHTSVHVYEDAGKQERKEENMEVRLDARVKNADEVRELGIEVGDFVSFDPRVEVTEAGFIKGRHMDDKASAAILLELILQVVEQNLTLPHTTHICFSTWEEVGFGANSGIPGPVREYLAVDMGAIGEGQTTDEFCVSICAKDSSGPYHYGLRKKLTELAEAEGLRYRVDIYPRYNSDASAAVRAGHDLIHGLVGPGVDASHAFERTHRDALENTYRLLYRYIQTPSL
ncbi:putative aminopeptidase FrvX [Melghirimyces profundicolus]|uniref:Putative aminopeptidase FrvX n=1 Tax=Melghirimyces profundicolus TaxID=1242148 RepID=A0A2T6BQH3_9BACL|nr:M42 family metallopeptidase [Melghirimyces profundicolus]PTX58335.1 putative aminopeptidase FrvX [Melghirimyces profundicolus]